MFASCGDLAAAERRSPGWGVAAIGDRGNRVLGRERYVRSTSSGITRAGMRNGYCETTIKTITGPVTPQACCPR